jgi:hypothetical protein
VALIEWFQEHPAKRFDATEVTAALGDELDIGRKQIQNYLNDLCDDDVLQQYGEKRIAYQLADDTIVPARYQVLAVLGHLGAIFDIRRWGVAGFLTIITAIWATLTFPFWFLWGTLVIYPTNSYASITRPEFLQMAVSMTLWLLVFIVCSTVLYWLRRWYREERSA